MNAAVEYVHAPMCMTITMPMFICTQTSHACANMLLYMCQVFSDVRAELSFAIVLNSFRSVCQPCLCCAKQLAQESSNRLFTISCAATVIAVSHVSAQQITRST